MASARPILIVHDDPMLRSALARAFPDPSKVVFAERISSAIERIAAAGPFEAILCDFHLPDGNGIVFYGKLLEIAPDLIARLVFMTSGATTADEDLFLATFGSVLWKPLTEAEVGGLVSRLAPEIA